MREIILFTILLTLLVGLLILYRRLESKRLGKGALDAMSSELRKEIERERFENLEKKRKFSKAMRQAQGE